MLKKKDIVTGMEVNEKVAVEDYEAYILTKQHVKPFPKKSHMKYKNIRDLTVCDIWGPS